MPVISVMPRKKPGFSTYVFCLLVHVNINALLTDYFMHNVVFRKELRNSPHVFLSSFLIGIKAHGREKKPDLQQLIVKKSWCPWGMAAIASCNVGTR